MSSIEVAVAQEMQQMRMRCIADPIYLGAEVLGYHYLRTPATFHRAAAASLLREEDSIFLAPRNHIKTTLYDIVGGIHAVLRDPNCRQLIAGSTRPNAGNVLREILWHFEQNQRFRNLFPEYAPATKEEEGSRLEFTVPCRTRPLREASFETTGQDTVITGRHYDIIRCVDLVVRENVPPTSSREQMTRTLEMFRTTSALLDTTNPKAHRTIDGTRWHEADMYGEILRDPGYAHFKKIIVGIETDANGDPIPVWPELIGSDGKPALGVEKLKKIRGEVKEYLWAANYMNSPVPMEDSFFRPEWFVEYDTLPPCPLDVAVTVDLAISDREGSDYTAIVVTGLTPELDLYVLSAQRGRWTPYEIVERLYRVYATYNPNYVGIESNAYQKVMVFVVDKEMRARGVRLPIVPMVSTARKEARVWAISSHAERSHIYVKREHGDLVDECLRFPTGLHDDLVDALALRGQDLVPVGLDVARVVNETKPYVPKPFELRGKDLIDAIDGEDYTVETEVW